MGTAGDDPRVSQAKTEGDVEFAWVPRQIEGDGPRVRERREREERDRVRERAKVANFRERNRERERNPLYCRLGTQSK